MPSSVPAGRGESPGPSKKDLGVAVPVRGSSIESRSQVAVGPKVQVDFI